MRKIVNVETGEVIIDEDYVAPLFERLLTNVDVNRERDRRILLPKTVNVPSYGAIRVDMAGDGRQNISDLGTAALAKISLGDTSKIPFRDADNIDRSLTNEDIVAMGLQIMQQVSAIHVKARAVKALDPIPADYADDKYWP